LYKIGFGILKKEEQRDFDQTWREDTKKNTCSWNERENNGKEHVSKRDRIWG